MKITKMAKIVYRQMPAPRERFESYPSKSPGQKLEWKSPGRGQFFCANPGGAWGDGYGKHCIRRIRFICTEIHKILNQIGPSYMSNLVTPKQSHYSSRRPSDLFDFVLRVNQTTYGLKSLRYQDSKLLRFQTLFYLMI